MNDLHYIRYDAKIMSCDIRGMSKEGKIAHFQLFNNLIIQDGFLPNRIESLLDYSSCRLSDWARVRGELSWKGWRESKNYFYHPGTIRTINDSKERYVVEFNRTCKINGKKPLALSEPHEETGVVAIIERDDARDDDRDAKRDEPPDANQSELESESIKNKEKEARPPRLSDSVKKVYDSWNALNGFPKCLVLGDKRKRHLETRLRNDFFVQNWTQAMDKIQKSDFCRGENERGWVASFDWFVQPDTVAKIMEGKYDNRTNGNKKQQPESIIEADHRKMLQKIREGKI